MDKKVAIIYKTKYGSTKKYAGWIAVKIDADLYEVSDIRPKHLLEYDTIIFGGGLYEGKINGINFITNNYDKIKDKELIIFTVGIQNVDDVIRTKIIEDNFNDLDIENIKIFNYRGAFEYKQLTLKDKIQIAPIKMEIDEKHIRDLSEDDKNLLKGYEELVDLSDKKSINALLETICVTN